MSEREALAARLYEHHFGRRWDKAHGDDREHFRMLAKASCSHILRVIDEEIALLDHPDYDTSAEVAVLRNIRARFEEADDE